MVYDRYNTRIIIIIYDYYPYLLLRTLRRHSSTFFLDYSSGTILLFALLLARLVEYTVHSTNYDKNHHAGVVVRVGKKNVTTTTVV